MTRLRRTITFAAAIPGAVAAVIVENAIILQVLGTLAVIAGATGTAYRLTVWFAPQLSIWPAATVLGVLLTLATPGWRRLARGIEERTT